MYFTSRYQTSCIFLLSVLHSNPVEQQFAYSEVISYNYSVIYFQPDFYSSLLSSELPSLLPIVDVAEALLHVRNGDWFLCLLVANVPDSFNEGEPSVSYFG